jgi:hypothetical protein
MITRFKKKFKKENFLLTKDMKGSSMKKAQEAVLRVLYLTAASINIVYIRRNRMISRTISTVLTTKGMTMSISTLMNALKTRWPGDPYAAQKASGSIGGAVSHAFITIGSNGMVTRVR